MSSENEIAPASRLAALADGLLRDIRYALRSVRKDYRFSLTAILALALGIGASTVVFSVVYNAMFETVPYKNFRRLVVFKIDNLANAGGWKGRTYFFSNEIWAIRENNQVFEEMVAYNNRRDFYRDGQVGPLSAVRCGRYAKHFRFSWSNTVFWPRNLDRRQQARCAAGFCS